MYERDRITKAIEAALKKLLLAGELTEVVSADTNVDLILDADGNRAVVIQIKAPKARALRDPHVLAKVYEAVHAAMAEARVEMWPHVHFSVPEPTPRGTGGRRKPRARDGAAR